MKCEIHFSNKMVTIQTLGCITIVALDSHLLFKLHLNHLPLKYNWKWFSYNIYANNMDIHALSCSVMECIDLESNLTKIIVPPYFSQLMHLIHRNSKSMQVSTHVDCTFMLHSCITTLHLLGKGLSFNLWTVSNLQ